ncbi:ATP-binding protein [Lachnospiraceae bacterium NSJ-143]|nr:ATP-binding protein [Lachnospiraceae bacterium NSJ-143]
MDNEISKLILYSDIGVDSIISRLGSIYHDWKTGHDSGISLTNRIYKQIKRLLDLSTEFGFDNNLWHNYLTFILMTNENSFSLTCERAGAGNGSVNSLAKNDFRVFKSLFDFDFSPMEKDLGIDCFTTITDYTAIAKRENVYNQTVSRKVQELSRLIEQAEDENSIFDIMTGYYKNFGAGMFGINRAFRIKNENGIVKFLAINNADKIRLDDLVGYESQKKLLRENTEAFVNGKPANNALLYGDSGTGKSSSVKALINEYYSRGLRMIEIYKYQFRDLSEVISRIKNRNYRFIIYIDDLSFEADEVEYKFLKAVIEGGVETRPDNILIYATSNRRHLIKETWNDRNDMEYSNEIHRSDTIEEKLSLSSRFGVLIDYTSPNRKQFHDIVETIAQRHPQIKMTHEELLAEANRWEQRHGGLSGRTAQQFINYLAGK